MVITVSDVQTHLNETQLTIDRIEPNLERLHRNIVFGRLRPNFLVEAWTAPATTPRPVRDAIAMMYAATYYNRANSESVSGDADFAINMRNMAFRLIDEVTDGIIQLEAPSAP